MRARRRIIIAVLTFYVAFVGFAFAVTFTHELGHAYAWKDGSPKVIIEPDQDVARQAIVDYQLTTIGGDRVMVPVVERTTVALYPVNILLAGTTLGLAPSAMMPDPVLASTFYSYDEHDAAKARAGAQVLTPDAVAMPMIVNACLAPLAWAWMLWRRSAVSMAAVWANAREWGFNVHHAEELGWSTGAYVTGMAIWGVVSGTVIALLFMQKVRAWRDEERAAAVEGGTDAAPVKISIHEMADET